MLDRVDRETEASLIERIDQDALDEHMAAFEGLDRVSGTDDEWEASEYVVDTLTGYGVDAELLEFEGYISIPESASVEVTSPAYREIDEAITTSFGANTPASGVDGELVFLDDLDGETIDAAPVEDRIVFARGLPTPGPVSRLEAAGARAAVFESVNPDQLHEMIVTPVWGTPGVDDVADIPELPVVEVSQDDGAWLRERSADGPVEVTLHTRVTTRLATLPCPVGHIEGSESDRYFIVGNHVDSWYEGATDNATAMAATLEIARLFADRSPRRGLVFGFWPGHSTGRYAGSTWYADEHWLDLRENAVAYLHIDLPGLKGAEELWYQHMAELADEHVDAVESATDLSLRDSDGGWLGGNNRPARNSDQSFWGVGASSLLSGARLEPGTEEGGPIGGGWWWHTPEDTRDKVDLDVLEEEMRLYVAMAARICESPVLPHDYTATVEDFETELAAIEETTDGAVTFDEERDRLERLSAAIERANAVIDGADLDPEFARAVEDLQVDLGNTLNPALYMEEWEYGHEPARPYERLPYLRVATDLPELDGRDRLFAETTLRRGRTKLSHRLEEATRTVEGFLDRYDAGV